VDGVVGLLPDAAGVDGAVDPGVDGVVGDPGVDGVVGVDPGVDGVVGCVGVGGGCTTSGITEVDELGAVGVPLGSLAVALAVLARVPRATSAVVVE
jgi:hypothetical protein